MSRRGQPRRYPRTARVNEVVREVLAEEIERLSDPRSGSSRSPTSRSAAICDHATVYYSSLDRASGIRPRGGRSATRSPPCARDARTSASVLSRQVRLKYLPELEFRVDPVDRSGSAGGSRSFASSRDVSDRRSSTVSEAEPTTRSEP